MEADITGLGAKPAAGWEARCERLCTPSNFYVEIQPMPHLEGQLSDAESQRLSRAVRLVTAYAGMMAAGMLKGVLKYPLDERERPVSEWMTYLLGEGADQSNYALLLAAAWAREHGDDN